MSQTEDRSSGALVEELRQRLREMRARVFRTVLGSDEELETLEAHQPGALSEDASREAIAAVLARLGERERHELDEIYAAQARLETGTFGVCEECARPVPIARLRAMPAARYCAPCQARVEASTTPR